MFRLNGLKKFVINRLVSSSISQPFYHLHNSVKCIHSFQQLKPRRHVKRFSGNSSKSAKPALKKNVEIPKLYMRDIISKIYQVLKYSSWDDAREQLSNLPIKWDSYTVNRVLKTHPPMEKAWLFFNWASGLRGFKHDQFTYTTMMDIFGEAGRIASMKHVFEQMLQNGIKVDTVTYTSLMHWVASAGDIDGAIKIWEEMTDKGFYPTVVSYTAYMKILFDNKTEEEATNVYKEMLESGISPNCHTYAVLMEHLILGSRCEEALEIFSKMQDAGVQPDKAVCNILVDRCCKTGETKALIQFLQYMKENFLVLRYPVFLQALETLRVSGESDALLREVNPHCANEGLSSETAAVDDDASLDRGLVLVLLKKGNLVAVDHLLSGILERKELLDSQVVSTIIEVNCDRCRPDGALLAFEYSRKMGLVLERAAFLSLIGILVRSETYVKVVEIVEQMIWAGQSVGTYLSALLIYKLGCARRSTYAARLFHLLPDEQKCTATYTALISVYFSAGSVEIGIKIYKAMKTKGIHPSLGTYNILFSGLQQSGRASEMDTYRKEKKTLLSEVSCQNSITMEERICDLLFAGNLV